MNELIEKLRQKENEIIRQVNSWINVPIIPEPVEEAIFRAIFRGILAAIERIG